MGWRYKTPQSFPATMLEHHRQATASLDTLCPIGAHATLTDAQGQAERYRWFRWCVRQDRTAHSEMTRLLETYDIRTCIVRDEVGFVLHIIAKPTKLSEFIELNPELSDEIVSQCQ